MRGFAFPRALVRARPCSVFFRGLCFSCFDGRHFGRTRDREFGLSRPNRVGDRFGGSAVGGSTLVFTGRELGVGFEAFPPGGGMFCLFFVFHFLGFLPGFSSASSDLFQAFCCGGGLV